MRLATCLAPPLQPAAVSVAFQPVPAASRRWMSGASEMMVPVPEMGDSITEGTILEWVKQPGDYVEMDDVVVVIETDKVKVASSDTRDASRVRRWLGRWRQHL